MTSRIVRAGLSALLLISSAAIWAAEDKPPQTDKHMDDAQMKKHCEEMMKDPNMSKTPPADHQAMMKRCQELKQQEEMKRKPPR